MGLDEDTVDLLEVDDTGLVADGFDEGAHAKVARSAQETISGTHDESEGFVGKCVVAETGTVELVEEEGLDGFGSQARQKSGVGDAGTDFLVDGKAQTLEELGLADEHQVVRAGKVLAEKPKFAQAVRRHEVGVVDDGDEHLAGAVDAEGLSDEAADSMSKGVRWRPK